MRSLLLLCFLTLFGQLTMAQLTSETIQVGAVNRSYRQFLPAGLDPSSESPALVLVLHGLGGTSSQMVGAGFNLIADTARVVVYYPQGLPNGFGQNSWNNGIFGASTADDIAFFNLIIDQAIINFNVDPSRVYITGFSMGSIMSHHMACEMNDRFAAIGCMAGTMPTVDIQNCVPTYATPVIHLHGTADGTVPFDGSPIPTLSLVPETIDFWTNVHGCASTYDSIRMPDLANDNITVDRFVYDDCNPDGSVELWKLNNADHIYLYQPVNDITEMQEIWWFFARWTHSDPAPLGVNDLSKESVRIFPNPADHTLTLDVSAASDYSICQLNGTIVQNGAVQKGSTAIDISRLQGGVYLVHIGQEVLRLVVL